MSIDSNTSDQELFAELRKGNRLAFRALFDRYYQRLLSIAMSILRDGHLAKDVVQEVFLTIWRKHETLEPPRMPEAYLKRSVVNRCYNQIRMQRPQEDVSTQFQLSSKEAGAQDRLEADDLQQVIDAALADLPERCRLVFVMKRMEGRSLKEIAETLDISPKTVENQMTKALRVLKAAVLPYLEASSEA